MAKPVNLSQRFQPEKYELSDSQVRITGKKIGPPSKRIIFHQKGLKVTHAQIVRRDKKGEQQFVPTRINHLPTFEQVRLHTNESLFPGYYEVTIRFTPSHKKLTDSKRELFPCIDEPEAWANAQIIKST